VRLAVLTSLIRRDETQQEPRTVGLSLLSGFLSKSLIHFQIIRLAITKTLLLLAIML
jgi:hypothetical protein